MFELVTYNPSTDEHTITHYGTFENAIIEAVRQLDNGESEPILIVNRASNGFLMWEQLPGGGDARFYDLRAMAYKEMLKRAVNGNAQEPANQLAPSEVVEEGYTFFSSSLLEAILYELNSVVEGPLMVEYHPDLLVLAREVISKQERSVSNAMALIRTRYGG